MTSLRNKLNDLSDHGQAIQADLLKALGLRGDVPIDLQDLETSQEELWSNFSKYIDNTMDWVDNVRAKWILNVKKKVQPDDEPHWFADYGYQEDPGYFKCEIDRACQCLFDATTLVAERDILLVARMNKIYDNSIEPVIEVDCPSESEALINYLKDTIDTHSPDFLVTLEVYTEELFDEGLLGLKDYLTAQTVIYDRLDRNSKWFANPWFRSTWKKDLERSKNALKGLKSFDNPPGVDDTKGTDYMAQDAFYALSEHARTMAGPWATDRDILEQMENIINQ